MKKIVSLIVLLFGMLSGYSQAELSIKDLKICSGETKRISIDMTNSVRIRAFQAQIVLPRDLKMISAPTISVDRVDTYIDEFGKRIQAQVILDYKVKNDGSVMILAYSTDAIPFKGQEGSIINLTLSAEDIKQTETVDIKIKNIELVLADGCTYVSPNDNVCNVIIDAEMTSIEEFKKVNEGLVDVYSLNGAIVMKNVEVEKIAKSLKQGVYIINGNKVLIK